MHTRMVHKYLRSGAAPNPQPGSMALRFEGPLEWIWNNMLFLFDFLARVWNQFPENFRRRVKLAV
jgi:hypothetical protein